MDVPNIYLLIDIKPANTFMYLFKIHQPIFPKERRHRFFVNLTFLLLELHESEELVQDSRL